MYLTQLLECSKTLGTCCSDYGVAGILSIIKRALNIIQLIAPIVLLLSLIIGFIKLMFNPEDKKGTKPIFNKILAIFLCFLMPTIINLFFNMMPEKVEVSACWKAAESVKENTIAYQNNNKYYASNNGSTATFFTGLEDYQSSTGTDDGTGTGSGSGNANGSAMGKEIVAYAKQFVGQRYVYGGTWNGELPYTPTDCSGFVQGVFKHFGINLQRSTGAQWADKSTYTLVSPSDIRAGDVVMYASHVGILTGNGNEFVHASTSATGIKLSPDYSYSTPLGIMRINGVN